MRLITRPQHQGHEHERRSTHTGRYTRPLLASESPLPAARQVGRRKRTLTRTVRTVAYKAIAFLKITYGEYVARCRCRKTFRDTPEGVLPKAKYDNKVRDLVLDRILRDGMNVERTLESIRREFLLDLSSGFVYDVLKDYAAQLDMSEHRDKVLEHFSGTLGGDELHLGRLGWSRRPIGSTTSWTPSALACCS
jgi:hypothetical protein